MAEQFQLFFLGSILVMFGLIVMMLSIKPRGSGSTGIILLGPIPIVWGGKNKLLLAIVIAAILLFVLLPLVFIL